MKDIQEIFRKVQPKLIRVQTPQGVQTLQPGNTRKRWATMAQSVRSMEVSRVELLDDSGAIVQVLDGEQASAEQGGAEGATAAALDVGQLVKACLDATTAQTKALSDALIRQGDAMARIAEAQAKRVEAMEKSLSAAIDQSIALSAVLGEQAIERSEAPAADDSEDADKKKLDILEKLAERFLVPGNS